MDALTYVAIGIVSGAFFLIMILNTGALAPRILHWKLPIDIFMTFGVPIMFAGTATAMIISFTAGITITIGLQITEMFMHTESPAIRMYKGLPQFYWKYHPAKRHNLPEMFRR